MSLGVRYPVGLRLWLRPSQQDATSGASEDHGRCRVALERRVVDKNNGRASSGAHRTRLLRYARTYHEFEMVEPEPTSASVDRWTPLGSQESHSSLSAKERVTVE